MKVSLRQPRGADPGPAPAAAGFLDPGGPFRLVGGGSDGSAGAGTAAGVDAAAGGGVVPLAVRADTLFGPRGVALGPGLGPLAVCDTGHHRLLLWRAVPDRDQAPADLVIGQPDFASEGANAKGPPGPASLYMPTSVAIERDLLVVADAWNHRVLIWHGLPERSNTPADVVLGQADFTGGAANRGRSTAGAETLNWCYGVTLAGGRLVVADTGNRRLLVWDRVPVANGCPADLVLGQPDFQRRDENAGGAVGPLAMRWPHAAAGAGGGLQVADAGNSRILLWHRWPGSSASPPDLILGQADCAGLDHNRGRVWPDASTLNMPYGIAAAGDWLVVADTGNSRLSAWRTASLAASAEGGAGGGPAVQSGVCDGAAAQALAGQQDFSAKGENRWAPAVRDSLCWPYAVAARDGVLAVADSGNNRVSLWRLANAIDG